jgi:hypothetical protein
VTTSTTVSTTSTTTSPGQEKHRGT